jgi:hypothetical protein
MKRSYKLTIALSLVMGILLSSYMVWHDIAYREKTAVCTATAKYSMIPGAIGETYIQNGNGTLVLYDYELHPKADKFYIPIFESKIDASATYVELPRKVCKAVSRNPKKDFFVYFIRASFLFFLLLIPFSILSSGVINQISGRLKSSSNEIA